MKSMKSKILALSILCITCSATQAMEDKEYETLLSCTNKTNKIAKIHIAVTGYDKSGCFRRSIDVKDNVIKPDQTFNFRLAHLPSEFRYSEPPRNSMISSFYGFLTLGDDESSAQRITWDADYRRHLTVVFDNEINTYQIKK